MGNITSRPMYPIPQPWSFSTPDPSSIFDPSQEFAGTGDVLERWLFSTESLVNSCKSSPHVDSWFVQSIEHRKRLTVDRPFHECVVLVLNNPAANRDTLWMRLERFPSQNCRREEMEACGVRYRSNPKAECKLCTWTGETTRMSDSEWRPVDSVDEVRIGLHDWTIDVRRNHPIARKYDYDSLDNQGPSLRRVLDLLEVLGHKYKKYLPAGRGCFWYSRMIYDAIIREYPEGIPFKGRHKLLGNSITTTFLAPRSDVVRHRNGSEVAASWHDHRTAFASLEFSLRQDDFPATFSVSEDGCILQPKFGKPISLIPEGDGSGIRPGDIFTRIAKARNPKSFTFSLIRRQIHFQHSVTRCTVHISFQDDETAHEYLGLLRSLTTKDHNCIFPGSSINVFVRMTDEVYIKHDGPIFSIWTVTGLDNSIIAANRHWKEFAPLDIWHGIPVSDVVFEGPIQGVHSGKLTSGTGHSIALVQDVLPSRQLQVSLELKISAEPLWRLTLASITADKWRTFMEALASALSNVQ